MAKHVRIHRMEVTVDFDLVCPPEVDPKVVSLEVVSAIRSNFEMISKDLKKQEQKYSSKK